MTDADDAVRIATRAADKLPLSGAALTDVYYYASLPLCVLDAIFSIGVRYESTEAVVRRYCDYYRLPRIRPSRETLPRRAGQESVSGFITHVETVGPTAFAETVVRNRQRTSARGGVLKAEAVLEFARVLRTHGIEYFDQLPAFDEGSDLHRALRGVRGQSSGISVGYFWMLAGSDDLVKPDRMILGFLRDTLGRTIAPAAAGQVIRDAVGLLQQTFPHLTPRLLDFEIWKFQRAQP
jgi:hypothetical protein